MTNQSENLLKDWNAKVENRLNPSHVLKNAIQLQEIFNGTIYSRIHRMPNGNLILEEREKGSMYPKVYSLFQDFSDLELLLNQKLNKSTP